MKRPANQHLLNAAAVVLVVTALLFAFRAYKQIGFYDQQIAARLSELTQLDALAEERAGDRAAFEWLQQQAQPDQRLENLVKQHLANVKSDLVMRESKLVAEQWTTYRYDMRVERISPERLSEFLVSCENARPPVRVNELQVTALKGSSGELMAQLSLAEIVPADIVSQP